MATVHARKRGNKWEYRFEAASVGGVRKQICKSGYLSKKEAMEAGAKAYSDYTQAGAVFEPNNSSFADYLDYWLGAYCVTNLKPITLENYKKKIRLYIKPKLGKYMLSSLSFSVLQDFINDIFNQGFSRNTLTVIKGILSNSLSYAVEPLHYLRWLLKRFGIFPNAYYNHLKDRKSEYCRNKAKIISGITETYHERKGIPGY